MSAISDKKFARTLLYIESNDNNKYAKHICGTLQIDMPRLTDSECVELSEHFKLTYEYVRGNFKECVKPAVSCEET